jgi:hypothetical protein
MVSKTEETAPAPVTPAGGESFVHRELNGATFLTLEHVGHMALVVILPLVLLAGIMSALSMWAGLPGIAGDFMGAGASLLASSGSKILEATLSLGVVATLLVLVPALMVLDRRTRAEWHKRPGYAGRLAYKVPVYTALAILGVLTVGTVVEMIFVVVTSLAFIGIPNAPIGAMYVDTFLPALIAFAVLAVTLWYVFNLAKGRDYGRKFSLGVVALGVVAIVSLFITSLTILHNGENSFGPATSNPMTDPYSGSSKYYQDLLNQYSQ